MKMKKECTVVITPTEKASLIYGYRKNRTEFELRCDGIIPIKREKPLHNLQMNVIFEKRIIASTDTELGLPSIGTDFLRAYCLKKIDTVIVEYTIVTETESVGHGELTHFVDYPSSDSKNFILLSG